MFTLVRIFNSFNSSMFSHSMQLRLAREVEFRCRFDSTARAFDKWAADEEMVSWTLPQSSSLCVHHIIPSQKHKVSLCALPHSKHAFIFFNVSIFLSGVLFSVLCVSSSQLVRFIIHACTYVAAVLWCDCQSQSHSILNFMYNHDKIYSAFVFAFESSLDSSMSEWLASHANISKKERKKSSIHFSNITHKKKDDDKINSSTHQNIPSSSALCTHFTFLAVFLGGSKLALSFCNSLMSSHTQSVGCFEKWKKMWLDGIKNRAALRQEWALLIPRKSRSLFHKLSKLLLLFLRSLLASHRANARLSSHSLFILFFTHSRDECYFSLVLLLLFLVSFSMRIFHLITEHPQIQILCWLTGYTILTTKRELLALSAFNSVCIFHIFPIFFHFFCFTTSLPPPPPVYTYFSHIFQFLSPFSLPIYTNSRPSSSFSLFPIPQQKNKANAMWWRRRHPSEHEKSERVRVSLKLSLHKHGLDFF